MSQIDDVFNALVQSDRKWVIDGRLSYPSFDDVNRLVNQMKDDLNEFEGNGSIQCGGIMLIKDGSHVDIYVHLGELE